MTERYYSPPEVAERYGVSIRKVMRWIDTRQLVTLNLAEDPNGERPRYRIRESDLAEFEKNRTAHSVSQEATNNG